MLTVDHRSRYRAEGYVVVRDVLSPIELERINDEVARLFRIQLGGLGLASNDAANREAFYDNAKRLLKADVGRYIATARMSQDLPSVSRVLVSEQIVGLAREIGIEFPIVSTKPSIHIMAEELKVPNGYHKTPPHQDWRSMQGSLDSAVLWIPTTPVGPTSHALEIVPGSHLFGLLDTVEHIMTPTVSDPRITDTSFVPIPVEPGDVIVFSSFMVHRTGEAGDGLPRLALSTRFNNALEPTFVERGYPTPYKYTYRLDLIFPDFPSPDVVRSVFVDES